MIYGSMMMSRHKMRNKEERKMNAKYKAELVYYTGETVVEKEHVSTVMKELEEYNGIFYSDFEMNGLVLIQKA
jgi:hypothetical protein